MGLGAQGGHARSGWLIAVLSRFHCRPAAQQQGGGAGRCEGRTLLPKALSHVIPDYTHLTVRPSPAHT